MARCYGVYNSDIPALHQNYVPCGSTANGAISMCCGEGQYCRSDGICEYSTPDPGGSGYYLGSCTDPTFKDPACPGNCSSFPNSDVVYNFSNEYWQCCGFTDGFRNCSIPVGGPLAGGAPPPMNLTYIARIQSSTYLPLQPSIMPLNATANDASPTNSATAAGSTANTSSPGGLSAGAGIGIGVVIGLVVAALAWLVAWFVWRKQGYRLLRDQQHLYNDTHFGLGQEEVKKSQPYHQPALAEIHHVAEIQGTSKKEGRAEVPA